MEGVRLFLKIDGMNRAAAISFFALFSLIPLVLLNTAILGSFLGKNAQVMENVLAFVKQSLPYLSDRITAGPRAGCRSSEDLWLVGLITLIWSADLVFDSMSSALAATFLTLREQVRVHCEKIVNMIVLF